MSAVQKLAVETLVDCPRCSGCGGACGYCGLPACREDEIADHPDEDTWRSCITCSGTGEVPPLLAEVVKRHMQQRAAIAPEPVQVVDADLQF